MKKITGHTNASSVVFSRWTRKAYAIFSSLKKEVQIGHLALCICEGLVSKAKTVISVIAQVLTLDADLLLEAEVAEHELALCVLSVETAVADAACVDNRIII